MEKRKESLHDQIQVQLEVGELWLWSESEYPHMVTGRLQADMYRPPYCEKNQ